MISRLHIENFKGWADTGEIDLAPITVLLGSNSSGKSSIGQFLMLLKQSIALPDPRTVFFLGNRESAVNLGLPSEMVFNRDLTRRIKFSYTWNLDKPLQFKNALKERSYSYNQITFDCDVKVQDKISQAIEVESFLYRLYDHQNYLFSIGMKKKESKSSKRSYEMIFENYDGVRAPGRAWDITPPTKFFGFPDEAIAYFQNIDSARNLNALQAKLFSSLSYLGPLRTKADRLYSWTGTTPVDVGTDGSDTIPAILAAKSQDRYYNFKDKGKRYTFDAMIAMMLQEMNLIDEFKVEKIAEERQEYEVRVRIKGASIWADIPDVGFGISQVLPVLVQLFYAPSGSIILMEQPELHLHPSAQAALADVMIYAIHARENAKSRNIQLVIETHSEHFLRRLQRRIAENDNDHCLRPENLRAYFVDTTNVPVQLNPLCIDTFGNIINWPKGFFGDIMGDVRVQANAALRRKLNGEK
jgi:AAA15 family ATPase/GTPase